MTMMLGIARVDEAHTRPMTAQLDGDEGGPIWFFTAKDNDLVQQLRGNDRAVATFASKGALSSCNWLIPGSRQPSRPSHLRDHIHPRIWLTRAGVGHLPAPASATRGDFRTLA